MELFWWLFVIVLFAVGLIGTVLPIFPGTTIILAAAVSSLPLINFPVETRDAFLAQVFKRLAPGA